MSTSFEIVAGKLSSIAGDVHHVELRLAVRQLSGATGVEDHAVLQHELVSEGIPDGLYVLEYSYVSPFRGHVQVKDGNLLSVSSASGAA
jgi:hypothetical protein